MIEGEGYRELVAGEPVEFDVEAAQQDSFDSRAVRVRRLASPAES
jgi:CspA family cold shock protein